MSDLPWGEFGISGAVIAGLLYMVFKMLTILNDREIQYRQERREVEDRHKEERADWQDREDKRSHSVVDAINKLAERLAGEK